MESRDKPRARLGAMTHDGWRGVPAAALLAEYPPRPRRSVHLAHLAARKRTERTQVPVAVAVAEVMPANGQAIWLNSGRQRPTAPRAAVAAHLDGVTVAEPPGNPITEEVRVGHSRRVQDALTVPSR